MDDSLLPPHPSEDEILEVLELWDMPKDAYPAPGECDCNYKLRMYCKESEVHHDIAIWVCLRRQCFITRLEYSTHSPDQPREMNYFSFWASPEFEVGPVQNHIHHGTDATERGYNHTSASVAFGEARILAGWCSTGFVVDWASQFKEHSTHGQIFHPILTDHIFLMWPDMAVSHFGVTDPHGPAACDEPEDVGEYSGDDAEEDPHLGLQ